MGKLENGQLVGSGSDESDEDDNIREIVEMLKNGEFTNVGPDSPLVVTKETLPSSTPIIPSTSSIWPVVPKSQSKVSKSAIMRSQGHLQVPVKSPLFSPTSSGPGTPITLTERSSPKVMSPQSATTVPSPPFSSPQADKDAPFTPQYSSHSPSNPNIPNTGMPSMIIDSPSFLNAGESLGMEPQSCQSMIIDSSIPPITPYSTLSPSTLHTPPQHSNPGTYSVTERPSVVMASEVRESTGTNRQSVPSGHGKKISRFLAERM